MLPNSKGHPLNGGIKYTVTGVGNFCDFDGSRRLSQMVSRSLSLKYLRSFLLTSLSSSFEMTDRLEISLNDLGSARSVDLLSSVTA